MSSKIEIEGYTLIKEIGRGGMGLVYKAVQNSVNRAVAIKTLEKSLLMDDDSARRMVREARISGKLRHNNIVSIYDAGESLGNYFISMELLSGGDLASRISPNITPIEAIQYTTDLANALDYAHKQGFVHRDIKPENIMFRDNNSVVITDFGIARPIDSKTHMTVTGAIIGTPKFMSPEQTLGLDVDGRSDLYSLASVFFLMLTGEAVFVADSALALSYQQVNQSIPNLLPPFDKCQWFFDKALAKEAKARFQSGQEMAEALEKLKGQARKLPECRAKITRVDSLTNSGQENRIKQNKGQRNSLVLLSLLAMLLFVLVWQRLIPGVSVQEELTPRNVTVINKRLDPKSLAQSSGDSSAEISQTIQKPDPEPFQPEQTEESRIQPLIEKARTLLDNPQLDQKAVQEIKANLIAIRTLDSESAEADKINDALEVKLIEQIKLPLARKDFPSAKIQLGILAFVSTDETVAKWQDRIEKSQSVFQQQQARSAKQKRLKQLIVQGKKLANENSVSSLETLKVIYEELFTLDSNNSQAIQLQNKFITSTSKQLESALAKEQFDQAESWLVLLKSENRANELIAGYQKKISAGRQLLNDKVLKREKLRAKVQQLEKDTDKLLSPQSISELRINEARENFLEIKKLDSNAYNQQKTDRKLATAYQYLANKYSQEKKYDKALEAVSSAIVLAPTDQELASLKAELEKDRQKRARNIISF